MTIYIPTWVDGKLRPVEKLEAHLAGLRHKAVSVFVMNGKGETLLQRRALEKYHTPGLWANSCCTHPMMNEDPKDCAKRRIYEELGLRGLTFTYLDRVEYRADVGAGMIEHEVVDIFSARLGETSVLAPEPSEVMSTCWVSVPELYDRVARRPETFTPWLRIYLEEHGKRIFAGCTTRDPEAA